MITHPAISIDKAKLMMHTFILQMSLPVIVFVFIIQTLPFLIKNQLPLLLYPFFLLAFLCLDIFIIIPYLCLGLFKQNVLLDMKSKMYCLGIIGLIIFVGDFFVGGLFSGVAPAVFYAPLLFGSLLRTSSIIILAFIAVHCTQYYFWHRGQ